MSSTTKPSFELLATILEKPPRLTTTQSKPQGENLQKSIVELDLEKPLVTKFKIESVWQNVQYKRLPHICFSYRRAGHGKGVCLYKNMNQGVNGEND